MLYSNEAKNARAHTHMHIHTRAHTHAHTPTYASAQYTHAQASKRAQTRASAHKHARTQTPKSTHYTSVYFPVQNLSLVEHGNDCRHLLSRMLLWHAAWDTGSFGQRGCQPERAHGLFACRSNRRHGSLVIQEDMRSIKRP